jgi:hypothetical protein
MILIGMFGSFMVIIIFSRRPFSQNPCSTYIVANGVLSFLILPLYYLPNIVTFGFQINWLALNTPFCKFQMSYGGFTITSILVINYFISFDRYAMSSRSVRMRSFHSKKIARILVVVGLLSIWCLIGIPVAIVFENIPTDTNGTMSCTSRSTTFLMVAAFFYYPIFEGVLPIVLAIFFWRLTRKQIRTLNNQEIIRRFDKQITRMCLFQIMANAIASFPFAAINLYRSLTTGAVQSQSQQDIVQFFRLMAIFLFYIQYCSDFYIYIITSNEIRLEALKILRCQYRCWMNRITVVQIHVTAKKDNSNTNKNLAENNGL